jgi:hypothetical protein
MQAIEASVHWDAEHATGTAAPVDTELAADAIGQTFEIMAPMRRARRRRDRGSGSCSCARTVRGMGGQLRGRSGTDRPATIGVISRYRARPQI